MFDSLFLFILDVVHDRIHRIASISPIVMKLQISLIYLYTTTEDISILNIY